LNRHIDGQHAAPNHLRALEKGGAIAQCLFRRSVRFVLRHVDKLEELVRRGHDVFYFGTGTCFEERQGVDEDRSVRDQLSCLLKLCQRHSRIDALLENLSSFDQFWRRR